MYDAATGNQVGEEYTDPKGGFRLSSSLPSVKLRFSGYDPRTGDQLASEFYMDKGTLAAADAVAPTSAGANVGTVVLAPGGSIAGRVTSEAGAPVYRAQACSNLGGCDWTDANGDYLIEGVDTGEHVVSFNDPIGDYARRALQQRAADQTRPPPPASPWPPARPSSTSTPPSPLLPSSPPSAST